METLRQYLNGMKPPAQAEYAKRCGTSISYLRKAISLGTKLDGATCRKLDEESNGLVPRGSLRPDIWPHQVRQVVANDSGDMAA